MSIKAVIFDLDGTLIDTEKYYRATWPVALEKFGYEISEERVLELRSLGRPFAPKLFKKWYGESFDYWAVREERKKLVEREVREKGVPLKPGVEELLSYLHEKKIVAAIATASDVERTLRYLELADLSASHFDRIVSAVQVKEGKPSPDVYTYACQELQINPEDCLAIEDAPNGIRSANSAGLHVIMIPDASEPDDELKKMIDARLDTLKDVISYLEELN